MKQIYPDEGLQFLNRRAVGLDASPLQWQLFSNDVNPTLDSVLDDFVLIDWDDPIELSSGDFIGEQLINHVASITAPNAVFENASGVDKEVYGYVVMDNAGVLLIAAARFPGAPITVPNTGSQAVIPIIGDYSEFSSTPE